MAQRRSTLNHSDNTEGEVYKIYTEVANAGKNIEGSKKRVKWLFGFTGSDQEHEVILIHSLVSGKKTILENGAEIVSVSNILAQDFSHGWQSHAGRRIYRVEANIGVASEHFYTFSVDGIRFMEMPTKGASNNARRSSTNSRNSITSTNNGRNENKYTSPPQRKSVSGAITNNGDRNSFAQSDFMDNRSNSFDPFESSDTADPFASSPSSYNNNNSKNNLKSKSSSPPVPVAVPVKSNSTSLFDNFDDDEPVAVVSQSNNNSATFDPFGGNSSNDPFGNTTSSPSSDPFAASPTPSYNNTSNYNINAPKLAAPVAKQSAVSRPRPSVYQPTADFLSTSNEDLFSAPVEDNSSSFFSNSSGTKKSAVEISQDFAGLSFDVPAPVVPSFSISAQKEVVEVSKEEESEPEEVVSKDPWDVKNLVDLDLTGKNKQVARKQTSVAGPSLDSLMGGHSSTAVRQPSFSSSQSLSTSDPIYALINKGTDPFGNSSSLITPSSMGSSPPPAQPPAMMSHAHTISSLGQPPAYMMQPPPRPVYGLGLGVTQSPPPHFGGPGGMMAPPPPSGPGMIGMMGPPPPFNPMGQTGPGMMPNRPVYGSGMMANKPAVGMGTYGMTGTAGSYGSSNPPKNSLDSLNWKG